VTQFLPARSRPLCEGLKPSVVLLLWVEVRVSACLQEAGLRVPCPTPMPLDL
jgi:hypothetical protein